MVCEVMLCEVILRPFIALGFDNYACEAGITRSEHYVMSVEQAGYISRPNDSPS